MGKTWRDIARPIIQEVLFSTKGMSEREVTKALHDAYSWGQRKYHPYKIWLDEIKVQRGKRKLGERKIKIDKNQLSFL